MFATRQNFQHHLLLLTLLKECKRLFLCSIGTALELFTDSLLDVIAHLGCQKAEICRKSLFIAARKIDCKSQDFLFTAVKKPNERVTAAAALNFAAEKIRNRNVFIIMPFERLTKFVVGHGGIVLLRRRSCLCHVNIPELFIKLRNNVLPLFLRVFFRIALNVFSEFFVKQSVKIDEFFHTVILSSHIMKSRMHCVVYLFASNKLTISESECSPPFRRDSR